MKPASDTFAAIDLGSNSFHLLLVHRRADGLRILERLKDKVQVLAGFSDGLLTQAAMDRGMASIRRFAQRLSAVPRSNIVVMGTSAMRQAANSGEFCSDIEHLLGVPVRVIAGEEEARLIYLGVSQYLSHADNLGRLIVDVGGGSTEFAAGSGTTMERGYSENLGCVSLSDRFFSEPDYVCANYPDARAYAVDALSRMQHVDFGAFKTVIGTSGSVESLLSVIEANGWGREVITRDGVARVDDAFVNRRWVLDAGLPGLLPDRVDIFPAGLAIISAAFEVFDFKTMHYVDAQLLMGMLADHLNLEGDVDVKVRTVRELMDRFVVDGSQALRVRDTALQLFDQLTPHWWRSDSDLKQLLGFAADLHEVGTVVHSELYHRHGAYLLTAATMPGFSRREQRILSSLVRTHRREFSELTYRAFDPAEQTALIRLALLLRLAVIMERGHGRRDDQQPHADVHGDALVLTFESGWLEANALSARELEREVALFERTRVPLEIRG